METVKLEITPAEHEQLYWIVRNFIATTHQEIYSEVQRENYAREERSDDYFDFEESWDKQNNLSIQINTANLLAEKLGLLKFGVVDEIKETRKKLTKTSQ
jgi:hypothetical protein